MRKLPKAPGKGAPRILRRIALALLAINIVGGVYALVSDEIVDAIAGVSATAASPPTMPEHAPAVLHPIERIAFSNDWRRQTLRSVKQGGHAFAIVRTGLDSCEPVIFNETDVAVYVMHPTSIDTPSSAGGRTGTFYEALLPRSAHTCGNSRYLFVEWKPGEARPLHVDVGNQRLTVDVEFSGTLGKPRRPMYVATTNSYIISGHCPRYCSREAELAHKYARILRAHHVQPIQNWIGVPPIKDGALDLDWRSDRNMSFRQTTMAYAGDGWVGFPRATSYKDKVAYLRALEETVRRENLQGRAWVYAIDEPKVDARLAENLKLYKLFAPSVQVMVTAAPDPILKDVVDVFAPVFNRYVGIAPKHRKNYRDKRLWTYASCMGSCGPNRKAQLDAPKRPGPDTKLADFLIDRPAARLFQFFQTLEKSDADAALYYEATEGYSLTRKGIDLIADPWNFGGNGDGLLLYPGRPGEYGLKEHQPIVSFRLKLIRHAIENYW